MSSREQARRITCTSNISQITLAACNYEAACKTFPGYHLEVGTGQIDVGWEACLLPFLDRKDVWKQLSTGNQTKVYIKYIVCPSDPPDTINQGIDGPSSYQANGFCSWTARGNRWITSSGTTGRAPR